MRYSNPVPQFSDSDGKPIVGGKLYFYQTNTTTLKTIYSDSSFTLPQVNPVITDSNGDFDDVFLDGLYDAVLKDDSGVQRWGPKAVGKISRDILTADAGGTADAITAAFDPVKTALTDEETVIVRASAANATTAPAFSPDGLTAKTITKNGGQALALGDIARLNHALILQYSSTNDGWELLNPALTRYGGDYIKLSDIKTDGTPAGGSSSGANTRVLNTEDIDTGNHCALASNQFTLSAGTYRILASAPAYRSGAHQVYLYNITDTSTEIRGTTEQAANADATSTQSLVRGEVTIASSKSFELRHYINISQATNGLGVAGSSGLGEIYAIVELWKVK